MKNHPTRTAAVVHSLVADGRPTAAEAYAAGAVRDRPKDTRARTQYASILLLRRKFDEALDEVEIVLDQYPTNITCSIIRAKCLAALGNCDEAHQVLDKAMQFSDAKYTGIAMAASTKALLLWSISDDAAGVISLLKSKEAEIEKLPYRFEETDPARAYLLHQLAIVKCQIYVISGGSATSALDEALAYINAAEELNPENFSISAAKGRILVNHPDHRNDKAIQYLGTLPRQAKRTVHIQDLARELLEKESAHLPKMDTTFETHR